MPPSLGDQPHGRATTVLAAIYHLPAHRVRNKLEQYEI